MNTLTDRLDACLPQTQCTRCGYPRCRDYATALAEGRADIDQCPPGGDVTIVRLAQRLDVAIKPLDPRFGPAQPRVRAVIDERLCIGCRKCLDVCPTDAIVGAAKLMHTVLAADCTGCELCLPPCPVDCIALIPVPETYSDSPWPSYSRTETMRWRAHNERHVRRHAAAAVPKVPAPNTVDPDFRPTPDEMRAEIQAAIERVRRRRASAA